MSISTVDNVAQTVSLVNQYFREAEEAGTTNPMTVISERLGWTMLELQTFMEDYKSLLNYDQNLWRSAPPVITQAPTESSLLIDVNGVSAPTEEEVVTALAASESRLKQGLARMGLSAEEAEEWDALQQFNNEHFRESMNMVSGNVSKQCLKLGIQSREIEKRLKFVREQIIAYGDFVTEERSSWVREERMLMAQLVEVGDLMRGFQDTWFRGSAQLALISMRYGPNGEGSNSPSHRKNRPKFHANQMSPVDAPP